MRVSDRTVILAAVAVFTLLVGYALLGRINTVRGDTMEQIPGVVGAAGLTRSDSGGSGGSATVKIVEYSDFQCPYCARVVPTLNKIKENYGGKAEITFKHFPLNFHKNARKAGEAAECARDQGRFWEYHDVLFANQNKLSVDYLKRYASEMDLDTKAFNNCLDSGEKSSIVDRDYNEGMAKGVSGTPAFFINDQMISGAQPYEKFAEVIDVMVEVNMGDEPVDEASEIKEVKARAVSGASGSGSGSCGGACGSASCGAATGGSCGCGG